MVSRSADDVELWRSWQPGDTQAFEKLVRRHTPRLLAVAARLVRDEVEADEVVQEAFIAAWRGAAGFDGRAQLSTWLHRITINAALGRLRRAAKRQEVSMEQAFVPVEEGGPGEPTDYGALLAELKGAPPLTALARSEAVARSVMRTLRALPR